MPWTLVQYAIGHQLIVTIRNVTNGRVFAVHKPPIVLSDFHFSPDGRKIVARNPDGVTLPIYDIIAKEVTGLHTYETPCLRHPIFPWSLNAFAFWFGIERMQGRRASRIGCQGPRSRPEVSPLTAASAGARKARMRSMPEFVPRGQAQTLVSDLSEPGQGD